VTSSVISRRTEVQCLPLGKPQGYRRPRFSFFRYNCQTAQGQSPQNVQPSQSQTRDDKTPGKPCRALYLRANSEAPSAARSKAAPPSMTGL
jgi:hypothetical protein